MPRGESANSPHSGPYRTKGSLRSTSAPPHVTVFQWAVTGAALFGASGRRGYFFRSCMTVSKCVTVTLPSRYVALETPRKHLRTSRAV